MGFDQAVAFVLEWEGGYVDDPADPGGPTRFGISQRAHPDEDIAGMTVERARAIYRASYWDACRCDRLPWPVSLGVFDGAVQHGSSTVSRLLQEVAGVERDGVIGPLTIVSVTLLRKPAEVFDQLLVARALLYDTLDRHLRGWWARLIACHRLGIETDPKGVSS